MRLTTKLSILALVFATALAFQPIASATTLDLVYNGSVVGTATLTQNGSNVDVSISMKSGFAIVGNGGDIGVVGSVSNKTTINDFSVAGMSDSAARYIHNCECYSPIFLSKFNSLQSINGFSALGNSNAQSIRIYC